MAESDESFEDPRPRIAVVGAGVAGLRCARRIEYYGRVQVFDKGRFPGGRVCTRDRDGLHFEHGAQYLSPQDIRFAAEVQRWKRDGVVEAGPADGSWVGTPNMRALGAYLADGLSIEHVQVTAVGETELMTKDGVRGPFDIILLAVPLPQASTLLWVAPDSPAKSLLSASRYRPCWTLMAAFDEALPIESPRRTPGADIGWAMRQAGAGERWVLQAGGPWSRRHLELEKDEAAGAIWQRFCEEQDVELPAPSFLRAHRWRYAFVDAPLGVGCYYDAELGLGLCGDGFLGTRVEDAWLSGDALADAVIEDLEARRMR
ncbi:MAG: FAD-dependent oxidoreductase [Myxococcota bacterium]